jgi:hypothetical protein
MGQGHGFCYRQGVLCILHDSIIRVSDEQTSPRVLEIDLSPFITSTPEASVSSSEYALTLLHYSDKIITVHCERRTRPNNGRILAISTEQQPSTGSRLVEDILLASSYKLFSRHTAQWLYYGTYSGMTYDGHHEWKIQGVSLNTKSHQSDDIPALTLEGFYGTDIGSTIAFEIHNGYFFAVSNQTSFEVEEIDWTSFYHCVRFPLGQSDQHTIVEVNKKVYRRQHKEGPIHDSWTDLTLQFDERTAKPVIVESRREWSGSSSRQSRTFYITDFESTPAPNDGSPRLELPENDLYTNVIGPSNKPSYAPDQIRLNPTFHPELVPENNTARSFILARTKWKGYNLSSNSFLDLVEDDHCCNNNPTIGPCIRIRVGSRRVAPLDWTSSPGHNYTPSSQPADYLRTNTDGVYRHSAIQMWPPPAETCACSKRLHHIMNPPLPSGPAYSRYVTGSLDEHALVYMIRSGRSYSPGDDNTLGVIVMVSFDRGSLLSMAHDGESPDQDSTNEDIDESYWNWDPRACKNGVCQ